MSKLKYIFIIALFLALVEIFLFSDFSKRISYTFFKKDVEFVDDCAEIVQQIQNLMNASNYCSNVTDCAITKVSWKGCYGIYNREVDFALLKKGLKKYYKMNCPEMQMECPPVSANLSAIRCEGFKCEGVYKSN